MNHLYQRGLIWSTLWLNMAGHVRQLVKSTTEAISFDFATPARHYRQAHHGWINSIASLNVQPSVHQFSVDWRLAGSLKASQIVSTGGRVM